MEDQQTAKCDTLDASKQGIHMNYNTKQNIKFAVGAAFMIAVPFAIAYAVLSAF